VTDRSSKGGLGTDDIRALVCRAIEHLDAGPGAPFDRGLDRAGRRVISAADVEAVRDGVLEHPGDAIITPEARDRARDLGVRLQRVDVQLSERAATPAAEALAERIADELDRHLSRDAIRSLAGWCHADGVCTDLRGLESIVDAGADRVGIGACEPRIAGSLAPLIDHTLLKPQATEDEIRTLCAEAVEHGFASVVVNPAWVRLAAELVRESDVLVCTVVGFPLGATVTDVKVVEARRAIVEGATEIDMVIDIGALKSGHDDRVRDDIAAVVRAAHAGGAITKVIIEAALLTDEEKERACRLAQEAGAEFVKTSTGFGPGGATTADVALMRSVVGATRGVKAAGGIGDRDRAAEMIAAGATRLGASAGIKIVRGE
jgi:deoxyribose-phosphate aldolase